MNKKESLTRKALYKLTKEELENTVNMIKNGVIFDNTDCEDYYVNNSEILKYIQEFWKTSYCKNCTLECKHTRPSLND